MSDNLTLNLSEMVPVFPEMMARQLRFVVVGCGGTGSYLIRDLAKLIAAMNQQYQTRHCMILVDKDRTEPKNVGRQNFTRADVGRNKAACLAQRYSGAFGLDIAYVDRYLTAQDTMYELTGAADDGEYRTVLVGCVDNNASRVLMHNLYRNAGSRRSGFIAAYIDSGNELSAGQVVCSLKRVFTRDSEELDVQIPDVVELFSMASDDRHPDDLSCAEHTESAPQDITANITAANIILNYCATFLHNASHMVMASNGNFSSEAYQIQYGKMRHLVNHVVFFDTFNNNTKGQLYKLAFDIQHYIQRTETKFAARNNLSAAVTLTPSPTTRR
jgi:PRTRC genetic system ThiF family protein